MLVTLFVPHIAAKKELDDGTAVRLVKLSHLACIWRSKNLCQALFSKYLDGCSFFFMPGSTILDPFVTKPDLQKCRRQ